MSLLRVAYLVGTSHCGSTLTALLFDSHPQIASVGEVAPAWKRQTRDPHMFPCTCGKPVGECEFWKDIHAGVSSHGEEFSAECWTNDYRYHNSILHKAFDNIPSNAMLRYVQRLADNVMPFHRLRIAKRNRINARFIQEVLAHTNKQVFLDTTKGLRRLQYMSQNGELDIRVIRLVRDGRAYANSMKRKGVDAREASMHWKSFHLYANELRSSYGDRWLDLRYEDLCGTPVDAFVKICSFLDVDMFDPPSTISPAEHHVLGNAMRLGGTMDVRLDEKWRDALSEEDKQIVDSIAGELQRSFGYDSETVLEHAR